MPAKPIIRELLDSNTIFSNLKLKNLYFLILNISLFILSLVFFFENDKIAIDPIFKPLILKILPFFNFNIEYLYFLLFSF